MTSKNDCQPIRASPAAMQDAKNNRTPARLAVCCKVERTKQASADAAHCITALNPNLGLVTAIRTVRTPCNGVSLCLIQSSCKSPCIEFTRWGVDERTVGTMALANLFRNDA